MDSGRCARCCQEGVRRHERQVDDDAIVHCHPSARSRIGRGLAPSILHNAVTEDQKVRDTDAPHQTQRQEWDGRPPLHQSSGVQARLGAAAKILEQRPSQLVDPKERVKGLPGPGHGPNKFSPRSLQPRELHTSASFARLLDQIGSSVKRQRAHLLRARQCSRDLGSCGTGRTNEGQ
jgi:hypothetical protein